MAATINTREIFIVLMTELDGSPLGGGPSRRGEYLTRTKAAAHVVRLEALGCGGFVRHEHQRGCAYQSGDVIFQELMSARE